MEIAFEDFGFQLFGFFGLSSDLVKSACYNYFRWFSPIYYKKLLPAVSPIYLNRLLMMRTLMIVLINIFVVIG